MNKRLSVFLVAVSLAASFSSAYADEFLDNSRLFKEVDGASAGIETLAPFIKYAADANADGVPDSLNYRVSVYAGGTGTLLRTTPSRGTLFPAVPCTTPIAGSTYWDVNPRFRGRIGSTRHNALLGIEVGCRETGSNEQKKAYKAFLYSVNAATGTGIWVYQNNLEPISLDGVDLDVDGVTETLALSLAQPVGGNSVNVIVRMMTGQTGALVSAVGYALER